MDGAVFPGSSPPSDTQDTDLNESSSYVDDVIEDSDVYFRCIEARCQYNGTKEGAIQHVLSVHLKKQVRDVTHHVIATSNMFTLMYDWYLFCFV